MRKPQDVKRHLKNYGIRADLKITQDEIYGKDAKLKAYGLKELPRYQIFLKNEWYDILFNCLKKFYSLDICWEMIQHLPTRSDVLKKIVHLENVRNVEEDKRDFSWLLNLSEKYK